MKKLALCIGLYKVRCILSFGITPDGGPKKRANGAEHFVHLQSPEQCAPSIRIGPAVAVMGKHSSFAEDVVILVASPRLLALKTGWICPSIRYCSVADLRRPTSHCSATKDFAERPGRGPSSCNWSCTLNHFSCTLNHFSCTLNHFSCVLHHAGCTPCNCSGAITHSSCIPM